MKYRKKALVIDAFQWTGIDSEMPDWALGRFECHFTPKITNSEYLVIPSPQGPMKAVPGDYIIQGALGEVYPCKAASFEATYELAE